MTVDLASREITPSRWDRAGILVSTACGIHCMLLPLLAGLVPFLGLQRLGDERAEWIVIAMTVLIGIVGHGRAYRRHHRHAGPGLLFVAGVSMILVTRLSGAEGTIEPVALGLGGFCAATAHWVNL